MIQPVLKTWGAMFSLSVPTISALGNMQTLARVTDKHGLSKVMHVT